MPDESEIDFTRESLWYVRKPFLSGHLDYVFHFVNPLDLFGAFCTDHFLDWPKKWGHNNTRFFVLG